MIPAGSSVTITYVGLGDSNASGEGNPPFYFEQCNRSERSYQYQAAQMLEKQLAGHTSVTFVADGCSGAKIQNLDSVAYAGISKGTPLAPQILAVKQLLAQNGSHPRRTVAAAFVSIGVNNIAFGPTIKYCIKWGSSNLPCQGQTVIPNYGPDGSVSGFSTPSTNDSSALTLAQWIASLTAHLPGRYQTIKPAMAGLVAPSNTFITEYPTFTYADTQGDVCGQTVASSVRGAVFPLSTWQWMQNATGALNAQVDATGSLGWHVVPVSAASFLGHGYCSSDPWFVSITSAAWNSNLDGPFHPNVDGAKVSAKALEAASCPVIATAVDCVAPTQP